MSRWSGAGFGAFGAILTLGGQWARYVVQLLSLVILARLINPSAYGLMAVVAGIVTIANTFGDFGLSMSALQAKYLSHPQRSNLFWLNLLFGVLLCLLLNIAAPEVAAFYSQQELEILCRVMSAFFVLSGATAQYRVGLNREGKFAQLAISDFAGSVIGLLVGVAGAVQGLGAMSLVLQQISCGLVTFVLLLAFSSWIPGLPRWGVGTKPLVSFGGVLFLTYVANAISSNIDSMALGRYQPISLVGAYDRAFQITRQPLNQIMAPLIRLAVPSSVRAGSDPEKRLAVLSRLHGPVAWVCSGALSLMVAVGGLLGQIVLGQQWRGLGDIIAVLAIAGIFQTAQQLSYWALLSSGRGKVLFLAEMLPRVLFVMAVILCARLGVIYVCWCVVLQQVLILAVACFWALPKIGIATRRAIWTSVSPVLFFLCLAVVIFLVRISGEQFSLFSGTQVDLVGGGVWIVSIGCLLLISSTTRRRWLGYVKPVFHEVLRRGRK